MMDLLTGESIDTALASDFVLAFCVSEADAAQRHYPEAWSLRYGQTAFDGTRFVLVVHKDREAADRRLPLMRLAGQRPTSTVIPV